MSRAGMPTGSSAGRSPAGRWSRARYVAVVDAPEEVADGVPGGVVYLAPLPDGPLRVLSGASAVLYRALVDPHDDPAVRVARELGVAAEDVDPDAITDFADELVQEGLLVRG